MRNRRKVVYYAILLLLILGELLGERNYIIIIFPEYDTSASKVIEPSSKAPPPQVQSGPSKMDVDPPSVINTPNLEESANADDVVSLGSPEDWSLNN